MIRSSDWNAWTQTTGFNVLFLNNPLLNRTRYESDLGIESDRAYSTRVQKVEHSHNIKQLKFGLK